MMNHLTNEDLIRLAKTGSQDALNLVFERNENLAHYIAWKFKKFSADFQELKSVCFLGMLKAFHAFDPDKGIKFVTFSSRCMENEVRMHLRKNRKHQVLVSIHSVVHKEKGSEEVSFDIVDDKDWVSSMEGKMSAIGFIQYVMDNLNERERYVFVELILKQREQQPVADEIGISQSRVSRIRRDLIAQIKKMAVSYEFIEA